MNPTWKRYLLSSLTTFATVAIATLIAQLSTVGPILWNATFWTSVALTVLRAAVKAVVEGWLGVKS